jgi:hypothetical protein
VPCGGGRGTRTPDLYSAIVALSQLSYAPTGDDESIKVGRDGRQRGLCAPSRSEVGGRESGERRAHAPAVNQTIFERRYR